MTRTLSIRSFKQFEFQYFTVQQKVEKINRINHIKRPFVLHDNAEKLLTDW